MTDSDDQIAVRPRIVWGLLAAAAGIVVAASWSYLTDGQAPYGDDNSAHMALMMHIAELWRAGVTDLWWNQSNLGLPLFMAYQPLPGLVSGTLAAPFAETGAQIVIYKATIVGLWATMPAAWYLGGRWLGLDRVSALIFGLLTLAVRDVHAVGFGFTAVAHGGLYTLVWGMWLLPMCVGAFRRYVVERDLPLVVPVALFVAVSMSHLFCGMYAGIATVMLVGANAPELRDRSGEPTGAAVRTLKVYLPALALLAFWLGPLLWTNHLAGGLPWKNEYYNGWPAVELFQNLLGGEVFDHERLPWVTVLVVVGVVLTVLREKCAFDRWLWMLGGATLVLFMGRTNVGGWYNLLPMHDQINVMRYTAAIHFCGLLAAAVAGRRIVGWGGRKLANGRIADREALAAAVCVTVACGLYGYDRYRFFEGALSTFDQRHPNVEALVDHLAEGRGTRFAVDDQLHTSPHFYRDLLPALADRGQLQSYALGYHATLSTYYADYLQFDRTWARLFNVGAYVAREPYDRSVVEGLEQTHDRGPYQVFTPGETDWGYFDFIRTPAVVEGGYHAIRPAVRRILVPGFETRSLPLLRGPTARSDKTGAPVLASRSSGASAPWSLGDRREWVDLLEEAAPDEPIASTIVSSSRGKNWYAAEVRAEGDGERLMLKVNYFPFWRATVDGEPVAIDHVAPNFMAIDVPAGRHRVRFTYRNPWWQKAGFVLTLFILTVWGLRRWQTTRR